MEYSDILARIQELEEMEISMDAAAGAKRVEIARMEAEVKELREQLSKNIFANTEESKELQELRTTKKWLER